MKNERELDNGDNFSTRILAEPDGRALGDEGTIIGPNIAG